MTKIEAIKNLAAETLINFWKKHKGSYFAQTFKIDGHILTGTFYYT